MVEAFGLFAEEDGEFFVGHVLASGTRAAAGVAVERGPLSANME